MKYGFTSTSFRQIRDIGKIVGIARDAGADCIEWGGDFHVKSVSDALKARFLCDMNGIDICSYGSYYRVGSGNEREWERICSIASAMGCSSVRVWLGSKDSEKTSSAEYERLVSDAKTICSQAESFGLKVCPECHDNTFNNNTDAFLKIREDIGADNFATYFQSRYRRREYDLDRIERTLPYTENVHISFSEQTREQFPLLNSSYIDTLIRKLVQCGFDGNMLVEYTYVFCYAGIPNCMINDIKKIKEKVGNVL